MKPNVVQLKNPRSNRYIKINRTAGTIEHKKSDGPYKNVPIIKQ